MRGRGGGRSPRDSGQVRRPLPGALEAPRDNSREGLAAWLPGRLPRVALEAIVEGDPLGVETRVRAKLRKGGWLLDAERVIARGFAAIAFAAHRYHGFPDLDTWMDRELERTILSLLEEDRGAVIEESPADVESASALRWLADSLGLPLRSALHATVVFHALPLEVRRAWYALAVDTWTPEACAAAGLGPPEKVLAHARRATLAMSLLEDPGEPVP